jgi:hypothetical protein
MSQNIFIVKDLMLIFPAIVFFLQYLYPGSLLGNMPSVPEHRAGRPQVAGVTAEPAAGNEAEAFQSKGL